MRALGRFDVVRDALSFGEPPARGERSNFFPNVSTADAVRALRRDGIFFGLDLPQEATRAIREWGEKSILYGNRNVQWGYRAADQRKAESVVGRPFTLACCMNSHDCPTVRQLAEDPVLHAIAKGYVGRRSRYVSTQVWRSYSTDVSAEDRNQYAQLFHFDLDDFRFLKFFFYLTDVDDDAGPHVYARGTHRGKKLRHLRIRRFSDEEIAGAYGVDRLVTIRGPSGTGFAEDTFGFHKATPPRTRDRWVVQIMFAQQYYGFGADVIDPSKLRTIDVSR